MAPLAALTQRFSRGHFAAGKISCPKIEATDADSKPSGSRDPVTGWLLNIKLSITGNEPDYVHDYRREYPDVPHQTTSDQVFEENQFDACRALGEHVAGDLFAKEIIGNTPGGQNIGIHDWFHRLGTTM